MFYGNEIIQIGAVRITEDQFVGDEFQMLIRPKFYRRLNRRVSKLTGIKESELVHEGISFPDAIEQFRAWCGEDIIFLTWGFDDIGILQENLRLHDLDTEWTNHWYNAQMIYNAQTDGSNSQKALKTAMDAFGIEPTRPAHDALGDAYHTALICAMLNLKQGIAEYGAAVKSHDNGFHGAEIPGCIDRKVFYGYADRREALTAMTYEENICPICGNPMQGTRWFAQPGHRYMDLATCPNHGQFLVRVRVSDQPDNTVRVSRLTYEPGSEAAEAYARRAERADPEETLHVSRRKRRRGKTVQTSDQE